VRRGSHVRRVGHAGTLDPAATGVLPLLLGQATRLAEYLVDATKTYTATVQLGVETATYDLEGEVVARNDAAHISRADVEAALTGFRGEFDQVPPAFSAIKRKGVPLYKLARRGDGVELEPRRVRVDELRLVACHPPFVELEIVCAKGFYVRSLAHDLGAALGVGGTLAALRRTRVGSFRVEDAVTIETLGRRLAAGEWHQLLYAPDEVLLQRRAAVLAPGNTRRLIQGQGLILEGAGAGGQDGPCRAYSAEGEFLGVMRLEGEVWRPVKVMQRP
jgi:tRNA pseudouridine55 synthase